jgi:hypothetical protein
MEVLRRQSDDNLDGGAFQRGAEPALCVRHLISGRHLTIAG